MSADVPARDRLDYLEQRARRKQHDVDNNPALQDAEYQAGAMFGCKDVLALVKVARAAREYMECFDLRGVEVAISDEAFAALRAALGRLDGPDKEQP